MSRIVPQFVRKLNPPVPENLEVVRLTPPGRGAVASILLHGPGAVAVFTENWRGPRLTDEADRPYIEKPIFGRFRISDANDSESEVYEEIVVHLPEPDAVEIHCHGGSAVVTAIESIFCRQGAAIRNFLDGFGPAKTQADRAFRLLPFAPTERTFQILLDQVNGALERERQEIRELSKEERRLRFRRWRENARWGRHLVEPFHVVLAGPANAGKSRLFNAILGFQRAIVDSQAGTTRDVVSAKTALDGFPVTFHDTAGFREIERETGLEAEHDLERQGIERSAAWITRADLVLWVVDATVPETEPVIAIPGDRLIRCQNKIDLLAEMSPSDDSDVLRVSAMTETGIDRLLDRIIRRLVPRVPEPLEAVPVF